MTETVENETISKKDCSTSRTKDLEEVVDLILSDFNGDTVAFFETVKAHTIKPPPVDVIEAALARKFAKVG